MIAILKKEFNAFFASPVAYLVIGIFLLVNGLFLWVFKDNFNILNAGFADLNSFFYLSPWLFLFLIPAITMKSFSEEQKLGSLELLFIKPISLWQTVLGKFFGTVVLAIISILPTFLYVYTVSQLGTTIGNLDMGVIVGSYFGLLCMVTTYTAIGIFASTLSDNQIVSFIIGMVLCFLLYYGFESLGTLFSESDFGLVVQNLGMKAHFESIARGVVDTRDLIYFVSLTLFFLFVTVERLKTLNR